MKKLSIALIVLGLVITFTQCQHKEEVDTRTVITKKIQYDVPIINEDPNYDWWIGNIEGSDREDLVNNIFDQVLTGSVQAYNYFNEPITVSAVQAILVDSMFMVLQRPYEPYEEYDTLVIKTLKPSDISSLRFLESWKYDEGSLEIDKEIMAICPVTEVLVGDQILRRPLFWVRFEDVQ